jgi:hypothetical protein
MLRDRRGVPYVLSILPQINIVALAVPLYCVQGRDPKENTLLEYACVVWIT